MDLYERLQSRAPGRGRGHRGYLRYNTGSAIELLPQKPLPHPELNDQRSMQLKGRDVPGAGTQE